MATKLHVTLKKSLCSGPNRVIKPKCFAYFGINPPNPIVGGMFGVPECLSGHRDGLVLGGGLETFVVSLSRGSWQNMDFHP